MGRVIMSGIVPTLKAPGHVDPVLNNNSWETISKISQAGLAAQYWNVGDTKDIVINGTVGATTFTNLTVQAFIIGIDHNAAREGEHLIHFQIGKIGGKLVGLVDAYYGEVASSKNGAFIMKKTNSNDGGWDGSYIIKTVLGSNSTSATSPIANTLLAALPEDLRSVMKAATKYSDNHGGGSDTASYVTATKEFLPLLSEFEYFGARHHANSAEQNYQAQYDYYKGHSTIHYQHSAIYTAADVWCRSSKIGNNNCFTIVANNGASSYASARASFALAPCFFV